MRATARAPLIRAGPGRGRRSLRVTVRVLGERRRAACRMAAQRLRLDGSADVAANLRQPARRSDRGSAPDADRGDQDVRETTPAGLLMASVVVAMRVPFVEAR